MPRNKKPAEETDYWKAMASGDQHAFAMIYELHFRMLYNYGCRLCSERFQVEDSIHAIFVDLWRRRQIVSATTTSIRCYLYRSLRNRLAKNPSRSATSASAPLSPGQSEALALYFDEEFSYDEIASILDVNEQSVRDLIQRSLAALRKWLPRRVPAAAEL